MRHSPIVTSTQLRVRRHRLLRQIFSVSGQVASLAAAVSEAAAATATVVV